MKRIHSSRRAKAMASTTAALGLMISGLALSSGPAQSAAAPDGCASPVDVATLAEGDTLTALSVVRGTEPQEFTGTVIGTIDDGIAVGLDMLVVDFEDPDPESPMSKAGGIWQGMSGSPVYVGDPADNNLVGAIAYGLSWGPSPIAGITPYTEMDDYLASESPKKVGVDGSTAREIGARTSATRSQAAEGFSQLRLPLGVTGISARRLSDIQELAAEREAKYLTGTDFAAVRGGRDSAGRAGAADLVPGGNLGASFSYGDISYAGVGTVTSVCAGEVVGFGHPMGFLGNTTLGMHPADALFVQPESLGAPFKVANISPAVGTVTDDRLAGITGMIGTLPDAMTVTSDVTYRAKQRTGSTDVYVSDYAADVSFSQHVANHDRVLDGIFGGTSAFGMSVTGTDEAGAPFTIAFDDTYVSQRDITIEPAWEIGDLVYVLSQMDEVDLDSVELDSAVTDDTDLLRVKGLEQWRKGKWTKVSNRRQGIVAKPGSMLKVRAILKAEDDTLSYVPFSTRIGDRARSGFLGVQGGASAWTNIWRAKTVAAVSKAIEEAPRNDEVLFELRLRRNGGRVEKSVGPQTSVVQGGKGYFVQINEKGGRGPVCRGC
ncbi:hypothetical protein I601_3258 [Nocardioides dokdonensis FR1436]|uniref:Peptidase S55 domain-containing protein n=2 Tax=Nocardioides TaxID=1839 RepID=A0A1A9GQE6_9ACTN|nr:hypothetical protein I601_3258 [Nocardioides dokdonensis FR1436]